MGHTMPNEEGQASKTRALEPWRWRGLRRLLASPSLWPPGNENRGTGVSHIGVVKVERGQACEVLPLHSVSSVKACLFPEEPDIRQVGAVGLEGSVKVIHVLCLDSWAAPYFFLDAWQPQDHSLATRTEREMNLLIFLPFSHTSCWGGLLLLKLPVRPCLQTQETWAVLPFLKPGWHAQGQDKGWQSWVPSPGQLLPLECMCCIPNPSASAETQFFHAGCGLLATLARSLPLI